MPAISFQLRWRKQLENGLDLVVGHPMRHEGVEPKLQTLRRPRKLPIKVGHRLKLWELQRSPDRYFIGEAECLLSRSIKLRWCGGSIHQPDVESVPFRLIRADGAPYRADQLARFDGFADAEELVAWMVATYRLDVKAGSLRLVLISWDPRRPWEA